MENKSSFMGRKVVVIADKLLLVTTANDIGKKIDWLKEVINATNLRLEKLEQNRKIIEDIEENKELRKHENVIRDTLRMKFSVI